MTEQVRDTLQSHLHARTGRDSFSGLDCLEQGARVAVYGAGEAGVGATLFPAYQKEADFETWPDQRSFHWSRAEDRFRRPFFFGRLQHMFLAYVFEEDAPVRFSLHPHGGGASLIPEKKSPAWDFYWALTRDDMEARDVHEFNFRLIYGRYRSDEKVIEQCEQAAAELSSRTTKEK